MVAIIIIIKLKISCINIRTSEQIKENFSYVEMPAWCMLLIKCKRRLKYLISANSNVFKLYWANNGVCAVSL